MSRTFEILERVQQDQELFGIPPVTGKDPVGGSPRNGKSSLSGPDNFAREEVLRLVQSLFLATNGNGSAGPRRVVFCGIDSAHGSNLLCARVGRSLAEQVQSQVCVVNANLRMPASKPLFDLTPLDGLPQPESRVTDRPLRRVTDNLWLVSSDVVPTNSPPPNLDQVRGWIKSLGDEFPYVVISAPPIGLYSDAAVMGQLANGVVLVLEANSTRRVAARKAKQALEGGNVRVLGTILNNRTFPIPEKIYHLF